LQESKVNLRIVEAIAYFRVAKRPFAWWVGPGSRPLDLEDRLYDHGLRATECELGMAMELCDLPPKLDYLGHFAVRCVTRPKEMTDFVAAGITHGNHPRSNSVARIF